MNLAIALVLAACLGAAIADVRTRRIPNALPAALFLAGIALAAFSGVWACLGDLAIVAVFLAAGTLAFSLQLIGGGDVKLLAAAAGTLGYPACIPFVLFTLIGGGLVALVYAATRGRLLVTVHNLSAMALPAMAGVRPARPQNGTPMPYALAIATGAICTLLANVFAPHLRLLP